MQKSLQEQSPYKKRGDQLSSSDYSNRSGGELTNYTEIMISTNNKEVPFISIFKPDSTKEHSRIQGATIIQKSIRYFQRARMRLGLRKMIDSRQHQIRVLEKCKVLCQMGKRQDRALMTYAFLKMRQNKMKSKAVCLAAKTLNRFQTNIKVYNKKHAFYKLQIHFYNACIAEIKDSNELCRKITNLQSQMQSIKLSAYSEHFASKVRGYQRYIGNFIQNVKKNDLQGVLRHQIKRFQQQRLKMTPRRREAFENEIVIIIITNLIKGYESKIVQFASKIEQMQCKIADLQSNEEMQTLRQQLQMRNEEIHKINQLFDEMDTFSAQIKRTMTKNRNHQNLNALNSIISTYTKKLQSFETQQSEGVINKMAKSGKTLCQVINILCQQGTSRQVRKKQAQFKVQQGETAMSTRFFNALQRTLISTQVPSPIIHQILLFKQHFQSIDSKYEQQVHQRIASQSLVEEMTMYSSQLKQQNENLKAFQKNYYDLVNQSKEKDTMIETLTNSILDKNKEIESLYQKVKQITLTGMNAASREKIDIGCKPRQRTVQLMKQLLTLKISIQNQIMVHQKEVRQMKNEIFEYQTVINQLQAEILQKDHRIAKEKEDNKKLQERVAQMSKFDMKQCSPYILSGPQNIQYELSAVRQESERNKTQIRQAKQNNQVLTKQINQIKRQFYKRQKVLQQKIRQKDESLSRCQMGSNELSNNVTPTFQLSQSPNLKGPQIMARDQEIQLLTTKVKSLQALLNDITAQYHDLQVQFQHINAFPLTPDISEVKQTEKKMPLAIREMENYAFMDDKVLSQKLKELMGSCESLAYSIDFAKQGLEQHIIEKRNESLHEKDSLLHMVFSILLDAQKIGPDSQQASKIWKELIQIKTNTTSKDLLTNLQSYSKDIIAKSIKK